MTPEQQKHAITKAERRVAAEPNNEAAHQELIRLYIAAGRRDDALHQCLVLQESLDTQGCLPAPETQALIETLARPSRPQAQPSRKLLDRRAGWMLGGLALLGALAVNIYVLPLIQHIQSLARETEETNPIAPLQPEALRKKATERYHAGDYFGADQEAQSALTLYRQAGDRLGEGMTLRLLGEITLAHGEAKRARSYYDEALPLVRQHANPGALAETLEIIAGLFLLQGDFPQARVLLQECRTLREAGGDRLGIASSERGLGIEAMERGDYTLARRYFEHAQTTAEQTKHDPNLVAHFQALRGTLACYEGRIAEARTLVSAALRHWQKKEHPRWQAMLNMRLAQIDLYDGKPQQAYTTLSNSLAVYQQLGDSLGQTDARHLRGRALIMLNRYAEAEQELHQVITFYTQEETRPRLLRSRIALASLRCAQNRLPEADQILREVITIAHSHRWRLPPVEQILARHLASAPANLTR
jgi:tetratricopeptide (TPR) repeat protein